jgi:hypothetical protein
VWSYTVGMVLMFLLAMSAAHAEDGGTVQAHFERAPVADVVAWAASAAGRTGLVAEGTVAEVDLIVGPVPADVGLAAALAALEHAGLVVTVTQVAVVARASGGDPSLPLIPVGQSTSLLRGGDVRCPPTTTRGAVGVLTSSSALRLYGGRVPARDGLPAGLRLSGLAHNGPVVALGLRNGDVLVSITSGQSSAASWSPDDGVAGLRSAILAVIDGGEEASIRVRRRGRATAWNCTVLSTTESKPSR